jgi:uncharacterized protein (TIGR03083 family)
VKLRNAPVVDVRPLLVRERHLLLALLRDLDAADWSAPTVCPAWNVKDIALHIIGDDLSLLSVARDGDRSGLLPAHDRATLTELLNRKNDEWVSATRGLSPALVSGLLEWTGREMAAYHQSIDLGGNGMVGWASDGAVPMWFDVAQDLTEHWLHQQQIRDAVSRPGLRDAEWLAIILRTLVWALPHHYAPVDASAGTRLSVSISGPGGGEWVVTRHENAWELDENAVDNAAARVDISSDDAWRLFSGGLTDGRAIKATGDPLLIAHFARTRAFLV